MNLNEEIKQVLLSAKSHIFHVEFIKKNGEYRKMEAVLKCVKNLVGGESTIKDKDYLLGCFDMKNGYRCIPLSRVISCKIDGKEYSFRSEQEVREDMKQGENV